MEGLKTDKAWLPQPEVTKDHWAARPARPPTYRLKGSTMSQVPQVPILAPALGACAILGKLINFSEPQFLHLLTKGVITPPHWVTVRIKWDAVY